LRAQERLEDREAEVRKAIGAIENNMEFLGITGVEDMLQEEVCQTLENIRNAGINVWMLTGDKIETAICIAISSGIKSAD
jgi:phospholipid-translocating ATPase